MDKNNLLNERKLYSFADLKLLGIPHSRWTLNDLERRNLFPKRVHLSPRKVAWVAVEINAFIAGAINARCTAPKIEGWKDAFELSKFPK